MSEAGAVDQRLPPGIDRVEAEIGDRDFIAGQIGCAGELIVRGAELGDEPVLVKLDCRLRHLFRHAVAKEENVLRGRRHVAGGLAEPLVGPGACAGAGASLARAGNPLATASVTSSFLNTYSRQNLTMCGRMARCAGRPPHAGLMRPVCGFGLRKQCRRQGVNGRHDDSPQPQRNQQYRDQRLSRAQATRGLGRREIGCRQTVP